MNRFLNLSYILDSDTPLYGNTPKPEISNIKSMDKGDSSNLYEIKVCNHSGTHVDAPLHFVKDGRPLSDYSLDELIFQKPLLVDIPKKAGEWIEKEDIEKLELSGVNCLLLKTGFGKYRNEEIYQKNNPGISPEAILFLREKYQNIRCLGIDSISVSGFQNRPRGREAHKVAFEKREKLGKPLLLIEDMNLSLVVDVKKLLVVPWLIRGIDSAPCTVLAEVSE